MIGEEIEERIGASDWEQRVANERRQLVTAVSLAWKSLVFLATLAGGLLKVLKPRYAEHKVQAVLKDQLHQQMKEDGDLKKRWAEWKQEKTNECQVGLRLRFEELQVSDPDAAERFLKVERGDRKWGLPSCMQDSATGEWLSNGQEIWGALRYIQSRDEENPE